MESRHSDAETPLPLKRLRRARKGFLFEVCAAGKCVSKCFFYLKLIKVVIIFCLVAIKVVLICDENLVILILLIVNLPA